LCASAANSASSAVRYDRRYVLTIAAIASLGGLLFGYDWVVIGGAKPFFEKYFQLTTEAQVGWANSCALLGCLAGSLVAGGLSDWMGRKRTLILSALLFAVSSLLTGWSYSFGAFVAWRMAGGVAIGMASGVSPMYIAEISPSRWRGRLVALNQLTIVLGILAAQIANWMIAEPVASGAAADAIRLSWNGQYGWRYMFSAVAIPSAVFFFAALAAPESPRWLALRGRRDQARAVLARIGSGPYADDALREIEASAQPDAASKEGWRELFSRTARRALLVGVVLAALQQWSGINVIFNYAEEIYRGAGYSLDDVLLNIVLTGSINLLFTLVAIATVDRIGRRALMLLGFGGIFLCHTLLGLAFFTHVTGLAVMVLTLAAIGCYAMTIAPVIWVLIAEIFPNRVRGVGVSAAVSALWIACFALTYTFPLLNRRLGPAGAFWAYGAICLFGEFFVWRFLPETGNRSLEEIEQQWSTPRRS
jgi:sugar porter (SP) family MFS transporter